MSSDVIERLNYQEFQYLGADDFRDQQIYHRDMLRRHGLGPHTWGIIAGLNVVEQPRTADPPFVDLFVMPGVAQDGFGRLTVVFEATKIDPVLFNMFGNDQHRELWIAFSEVPLRPATGGFAPCLDGQSYSRVEETFRFVAGPFTPSHDDVMVGGKAALPAAVAGPNDPVLPDDESVAYQALPEQGEQARWLVRLGSVHWDGTVQKFRPVSGPDRLIEGRIDAGLIGATLLAPTGALRVAPRFKGSAYDPDALPFAALEGRLRVDGGITAKKDVFLHGGMLSFQSTGGLDDQVPLWMQRLAQDGGGTGADLRIHIGDKSDGTGRLTIGSGKQPTTPATEDVVLAARNDGMVDIPTGKLRFGSKTRQMIDLWAPDDKTPGPYGIGVQGGADYFRTGGDFYWFLNGKHDDANGQPGAGGKTLMRLDAQGCLNFGSQTRQMLNLWNPDFATPGSAHYGIGVQSATLYARSDFDFCWFRGGSHSDTQSDPGGGQVVMKLDSASQLTLSGSAILRGDVQIWGGKLDLRQADGGTNTDPLEITRFNRAPDATDLRIVIGDNVDNVDRLVVGPLSAVDGVFKENFIVTNLGDVRIAGDLYIKGWKINGIDVKAGSYFLNQLSVGSGTVSFIVPSRFNSVSGAELLVALSDIANVNVATDARWRVQWKSPATILPGGFARFDVDWQVEDIDGHLLSFTYLAVFVA
jgi:hypothetical protein